MDPIDPGTAAVRPLPVLRATIDALDRDLLHLLARRAAVVAEIAARKRADHLEIRDRQREGEILAQRRALAARLGLAPDLVESLFRLILWGSRDRQASLKVEVPPDLPARSVAVIGGHGAMGRCMAELFADLGQTVLIADLDTHLTPVEAAAVADVVLVSVPIAQTPAVIADVGPHVKPDGLLMDVTSIKAAPVAAMLAATPAAVIGTHPLFGPSVHSLQGQRIVVTPGRGADWLAWVRQMFHARGLNVVETSPEQHDRLMGVVQVLVHFATETMGLALARLGVALPDALAFTSPIYLMDLLLTARHFAQAPELYGAIQMSNPATAQVTAAFIGAAEQLRAIAAQQDHRAFREMFDQVRAFLGPFTQQALGETDFLIDRLVERM